MKSLGQFVVFGLLLNLAATNPLLDNMQGETPLAYDDNQDPHLWQNSGKFEGDMILTPEQTEYLRKDDQNRNGVIDVRLRWDNKRIPYEISNDFTASQKKFIENALKEDYARSCFSIVPRTNEKDYVYVTGKNTGCWSYVGRIGGKQELNLQRQGCLYYHIVVHEFLHAAGFFHQQSASERDDFVTIQWDNIKKGQEHNFDKYGSNVVNSFDQRYDYDSVMHYDAYSFSKNGNKTIVPKEKVEIGKATKLSPIDIAKLNAMYSCELTKPGILKNEKEYV